SVLVRCKECSRPAVLGYAEAVECRGHERLSGDPAAGNGVNGNADHCRAAGLAFRREDIRRHVDGIGADGDVWKIEELPGDSERLRRAVKQPPPPQFALSRS